MNPIILVNFGGPRHLNEVYPFLKELLTDTDVIRTGLPKKIQRWLFSTIAKIRSKKTKEDYKLIGGGSPIYFDTEHLAKQLNQRLKRPIYCFHRYLPETHKAFFEDVSRLEDVKTLVFPLFPQFTYATTGSIARYFQNRLPKKICDHLRWIKSYPEDPLFIRAHTNSIQEFCHQNNLDVTQCVLLFSAHGLPQKFIDEGDIYYEECQKSFKKIAQNFLQTESILSFQSKFGRGEWLKPYTNEICENPPQGWSGKTVLFIPLSFTSDHIETLFEIEKLYLPPLKEKGINAMRVPALTLREDWIIAIENLINNTSQWHGNEELVRQG